MSSPHFRWFSLSKDCMAPSKFSQNNLVKYYDVTFALISPDTGPLVNIIVLMASLRAYQLTCLTITCLWYRHSLAPLSSIPWTSGAACGQNTPPMALLRPQGCNSISIFPSFPIHIWGFEVCLKLYCSPLVLKFPQKLSDNLSHICTRKI